MHSNWLLLPQKKNSLLIPEEVFINPDVNLDYWSFSQQQRGQQGQKEANIHGSCTDFQKAVSVESSLGLVGLVAALLTEHPL